ncbi:MAG: hypothetical protein ACLP51_20280 [Syntrophobacteraceae bacterium]
MTMDAFRLESGGWFLLGSYAENDKVRAGPFQEIETNPGDLWIGSLEPPARWRENSKRSYSHHEEGAQLIALAQRVGFSRSHF